ncbi:MAG: flagellar protein [Paracoccaceae bacterium]|nr:MAG: DUF1217 domain-containing protein [Alphaproteobacteria bacterium]GIX15476.1 MAG: flagellar protein [Paracoccaceae bacterium]
MSFLPAIPIGGIAGWQFLKRTEEAQRAVFDKNALIARETAYFRENIAKADSIDKLMADRTLLKVALGAFGLEDELPKKAWIRKILEEGTQSNEALAMRLTDRRYRQFAEAMGYGNPGGARVADPGFADRMIAAYRTRQFEVAVGEVDDDMRLALNFRRAIAEVVSAKTEKARWFAIMGDKPIRTVIDAALGMPKELAKVDVDKQVDFYAERAARVLKIDDPQELADPGVVEETIRRFLVRRQIENGPSALTPGMGALTLLQGAVGFQNLVLSNG